MKLKAPKNVSSLSHGGEEFTVTRGRVDIPDENSDAIQAAIGMGFVAPEDAAADAVETRQEAQ